jgi:hypothetical protein
VPKDLEIGKKKFSTSSMACEIFNPAGKLKEKI